MKYIPIILAIVTCALLVMYLDYDRQHYCDDKGGGRAMREYMGDWECIK